MALKDLSSLEVQTVKSALEFMRKAMVRQSANAKGENLRDALRKDIAQLDVVISKV